MNVIVSGYGRMGKQIEQIALGRGHKIVAVLDNASDFDEMEETIRNADVAIDFSLPETAADNIIRFIRLSTPVVVGTTGWYQRFEEIKKECLQHNGALLYSTNMSIGVNLFFRLNRVLAQLMHPYPEYRPCIEETHHIHKKDAPSGTALTLAEDTLKQYDAFSGWQLNNDCDSARLPVFAHREGEVVGEHIVKYSSSVDEIAIRHTAFSREGFALGAVLAAEWIRGKHGIFTMQDVLDTYI